MMFGNTHYNFLWICRYFILFGASIFVINCVYQYVKKYMMLKKFPAAKVESYSRILGLYKAACQPSEDVMKMVRGFGQKYYPHFRSRVLHKNIISILSPEDCEIIMGTKKHSSKGSLYVFLKNWLNDGLLLSRGDKWMMRRKILTPTFHFEILTNFIETFNEHTANFLEFISANLSQPIEICPTVKKFTLLAICETAMGHKLDPENKEQNEYLKAIYEIEKIFKYRFGRPWLLSPFLFFFSSQRRREKTFLKILHNFTRNIIKDRIKNFEGISYSQLGKDDMDGNDELYVGKKKNRLAMLDILIQAQRDGEKIDYEGICEEVDTFMFEGHDTTASSIEFTLMLLANHPDIQEKIYEELESILGETKRKPTLRDLQKMDLLERCIKESLRLYPSVHFIARTCDEDTVLNSGLVLPKGIDVHIEIFSILRNPRVFSNPDKFDPDRFLLDNCQSRHPFAYIPFSAGPRNCIGQRFAMLEIKTLMAGIIQNFKLVAVDTPDTIILTGDSVLRSKNGIKMIFNPRKSK